MQIFLLIVPIKPIIPGYLSCCGMNGLKWEMNLSAPPAVFQKDFRKMGAHTGQQPVLGWFFSTSSLQPALYGKKNVPGERDESWQMEGSRLLSQTRGGMVDEVVALGEGSSKGQWRC